MNKHLVAIVRYRNKIKSVSKAIELSGAFRNLSGNEKVFLKPNERKSVSLQVKPEDLAFFDEGSNKWKIENGMFKILIGSSSRDIRLSTEFEYIK